MPRPRSSERERLVARLEGSRRVHIVGGPGTGKSTLSHRLGDVLGLPVHPLDTVAFEGQDFTERPLSYCEDRVQEIAATDRWVTEGIFAGWTEPLLRRADAILWLDHSGWGRAAARIVLRAARGATREVAVRRGRERFLRFGDYSRNARQLFAVLRDSRDFWRDPVVADRRYPVTRSEVVQGLSPHASKVVRLTRGEQVAALSAELDRISTKKSKRIDGFEIDSRR